MGDAVWKVKLCGLIQRGDCLDLVRDWNDCVEVTALINTGANASVITRALANRAGAEIIRDMRTFGGCAYAGALMALALEGGDRSNHVVIVDDLLAAEANSHGGMILGRDYLSCNRVRIDEVREDNLIRLKITRAEATALRGFARQLTGISIDASDDALDERGDTLDERGDDGDELRRQVHQGGARDRGADPLAGLVREVRPEVEPNRTSGDVLIGHDEIRCELRARGKYRSNHCYLYFEVERKKRAVSVETSWLPDLPLVRDVLSPLGFAREARGAWRASVPIDDFLGVARRVTRALELMLTEALQMIE